MRFLPFLIFLLSFSSCQEFSQSDSKKETNFKLVTSDINCSVRAIKAIDDKTMWFAGSGGKFGYTENQGIKWHIDSIQSNIQPKLEFRGIEVVGESIFLLAVASPALLYKSTDKGATWKVVYQEDHEAAFYDAIAFWDEQHGIAMGDPTDGCISIILTENGGESWHKIPCENLPAAAEGEAAFAASNSNISLSGNEVWIVTGGKKARVLHSPDRGKSWTISDTPIAQGGKMTGIFTCDFYDSKNGIIMGGDWENKAQNTDNKAVTTDGGKTWTLIADGKDPGYRSCVQYRPEANGKEFIAVGTPGVSYSYDSGMTWKQVSEKGFYTIRFSPKGNFAWLAGDKKIGWLQIAP